MTTVVFLSPAQEEMIAAAQYYQHQSIGLGAELLAEVERTIAAIAVHPKAAPKVAQDIRRRLLKRFPFGILYVAPPMKSSFSPSCISAAALVIGKTGSVPERADLKENGLDMGFTYIESGPLVRSSYHAERQVA